MTLRQIVDDAIQDYIRHVCPYELERELYHRSTFELTNVIVRELEKNNVAIIEPQPKITS